MTYDDYNDAYISGADEVFEEDSDVGTLEYVASLRELSEAGLGDGFSIRHIDLMPEHESEFVPPSAIPVAILKDELQALNDQLNTTSSYRPAI